MSLEMLEVYRINQAALKEFNIQQDKFLKDRNITAIEFIERVHKLRNDRISPIINNPIRYMTR